MPYHRLLDQHSPPHGQPANFAEQALNKAQSTQIYRTLAWRFCLSGEKQHLHVQKQIHMDL
ncbi:hypothetical protein D9M71_485430 [compost metagenome]